MIESEERSDGRLGSRMEQLADEATADIRLQNPAGHHLRSARSQPRSRLVLLGAMAAVCLAAVLGARLALDRSPADVGPTVETELPPQLEQALLADQPTLDLDSAVAGPTVDDVKVYALWTGNRQEHCLFAFHPGPADESEGWTSASTCSAAVSTVTSGYSAAGMEPVDGAEMVFGVTTEEAVEVLVGGRQAAFSNQLFLIEGSLSEEISVRYRPEHQARVDGCQALGEVTDALRFGLAVDADDLDRLRTNAEPAGLDSLGRLADQLAEAMSDDGRVALGRTDSSVSAGPTGSTVGETIEAAVDGCRRNLVPGWAVLYFPDERERSIHVPPPAPAVDLTSFGTVQQLVETGEQTLAARGPGLGPLTRVALDGLDVTTFQWTRQLDGPGGEHCLFVLTPGLVQSGCDPTHGQIIAFDRSGAGGNPDNRRSEEDASAPETVYAWNNRSFEAFATVTVGGTTVVQRPRSGLFTFGVDAGPAVITAYDAEGTELWSEAVG